jgi:hypothetical protein
MPFTIPKLEPEWVHLHEAAAHVMEREPPLDVGQVRKTLRDAIAYDRLRVHSDDSLNDALTWTAYRARRQGLVGSTFAETWSRWLEGGAEIGWDAGMIFVSMAGRVVPVRLPRVRLADVFGLFEVPEEKPVPEEASTEEVESEVRAPAPIAEAAEEVSEQGLPAPKKQKVLPEKLKAWYGDWVKNWPPGQNPPSEKDDWDAAITHFSRFNVRREQIRKARSELAPEVWQAHGRRPDFQDPDKLAEKLAIKLADKPAKK